MGSGGLDEFKGRLMWFSAREGTAAQSQLLSLAQPSPSDSRVGGNDHEKVRPSSVDAFGPAVHLREPLIVGKDPNHPSCVLYARPSTSDGLLIRVVEVNIDLTARD